MFANLTVQENAPDEYNGYPGCNVVRFVTSDADVIARIVEALENSSIPELNSLRPQMFNYGPTWLSGELWLTHAQRTVFLNAARYEAGIEIELSTSVYWDRLDHTNHDNTDRLFWLDFVQPMHAIAAGHWNVGPEWCWVVFKEPRPASTCLNGLLASEVRKRGSVYGVNAHTSALRGRVEEEGKAAIEKELANDPR